jgi:uncharacterized membrane protein
MTDPPAPDRTLEQRRLLLEQTEARLTLQSDAIDGLDRKATAVLASTGVLLGLVINNTGHFAASSWPVPSVFYAALIVLAVGLIAGVHALWLIPFWAVPEPGPLLAQHSNRTPEETIGELVTTKAEAFRLNTVKGQIKVDRLRRQMFLFMSGGGLLVGAYVLERFI